MNAYAQSDGTLSICASDCHDMEQQLTLAVEILIPHALRLRDRGILLTRTSPTDIIVELHPDVPFGITQERQDW